MPELDETTDAAMLVPGDPSTDTPETELSEIESFSWLEMFTDSRSATVVEIRRLSDLDTRSTADYGPLTLGIWGDKVRRGGEWDHRADLKKITGGRSSTPAPDLGGEIRFDVWSNIHYGYVGRQSGIDAVTLEAGAGVADIVDRLAVDRADQLAVRIGIELHDEYGADLRPEHLHEALVAHRDELIETGAVRAN